MSDGYHGIVVIVRWYCLHPVVGWWIPLVLWPYHDWTISVIIIWRWVVGKRRHWHG